MRGARELIGNLRYRIRRSDCHGFDHVGPSRRRGLLCAMAVGQSAEHGRNTKGFVVFVSVGGLLFVPNAVRMNQQLRPNC